MQKELALLELMKKRVEDFTNHIDECIGVEIGENSCAYTDSNDIQIGLKEFLYRDSPIYLAHEDYYLNNGFDYKKFGINYETFIILHEIGHLQEETNLYNNVRYSEMVSRIKRKIKDPYEQLLAYVRIPAEDFANKWAINFLRKNRELCIELEKDLLELKSKILKELN